MWRWVRGVGEWATVIVRGANLTTVSIDHTGYNYTNNCMEIIDSTS